MHSRKSRGIQAGNQLYQPEKAAGRTECSGKNQGNMNCQSQDFQNAFLKFLAKNNLQSADIAVMQYMIMHDRAIYPKYITESFQWDRHKTYRAVSRLLSRKILLKLPTGKLILNKNWREWKSYVGTNMIPKVLSDNFHQKISEELVIDLVSFAKSKRIREDDAQDIVQTALLKAKKHYGQFREGTNFRAWIFKIAKNAIHDYYRKRRESQLFEGEIDSIADLSDEIPVEDKIDLERFRKQLKRLDPYYQELIEASINKIPYRDISILYGVPEGTVKSMIHRAKKKLYELVSNSE